MSTHFFHDLETLKRELLTLGGAVEKALKQAVLSLTDRRKELAQQVMEEAGEIDRREMWIENQCLKTLALHQVVAGDLRMVIGIMKVNNDLERMGDLAFNLARRSGCLCGMPPVGIALDFPGMSRIALSMVKDCLDALVNLDTGLASDVLKRDDLVDAMKKQMYAKLMDLMKADPNSVERAVHLMSVSRHLERVADLSTNIAEDVVFMVEGEVVRHQRYQ